MLNVYLVRHGKTMFNTIGRAQGWSDTPLTAEGEAGIKELGVGFRAAGLHFDRAYSSDSGRTIQTMGLILKYSENEGIPYKMEPKIREWCFGSFEGGYDGDLFDGVLPRIFIEEGVDGKKPSYEQIANAIVQVDTANWAQPWPILHERILTGFTEMAQESEDAGSASIVIVSHGMTIGTFVKELQPDKPRPFGLDNGSVTRLTFEKGKFIVQSVGDMSYREEGRRLLEAEHAAL